MKNRTEDFAELIRAARREPDPWAYLESLIDDGRVDPVDLAFFAEALVKVARERGANLLNDGSEKRCSFCLKTDSQVKALVAAPNANICCECVEIARKAMPRTGVLRSLFGSKRSETPPVPKGVSSQ